MNIEVKKIEIFVTVPSESTEKVRKAMCDAGAGIIGNYTYCTSSIKSVGTFIPNEKANPYIGKNNQLEYVDEDKLEVICDIKVAKKVIQALRKAHPYEEPAISIVPLIDEDDLIESTDESAKNNSIIEKLCIRKCTANDIDEICNIQKVVIDNFKEEEKGYFLPFKKETFLKILKDPINEGEIYGAFIENKMIAWIFLSVSNVMKELKQMIPNVNGSCADIDGVMVLQEYRGYGLQKILVKYLEERAIEKGINNIIAEVTFGNIYSLRNLKDLGYEQQTWYQKAENIKRYILLKKLSTDKSE
jgi:GNAT superfamily N-acetyltransferase